MVSIGSGVSGTAANIRLGNAVVSAPQKGRSGVVQYDFGENTPARFVLTGALHALPQLFLSALSMHHAEDDNPQYQIFTNLIYLFQFTG
jgi:ankyrin repeat domain-containing protein 50